VGKDGETTDSRGLAQENCNFVDKISPRNTLRDFSAVKKHGAGFMKGNTSRRKPPALY